MGSRRFSEACMASSADSKRKERGLNQAQIIMKPAHLIAKPKSKPESQTEIDSSSAHKAEEEVANQVGVPRFLQQASGSGAASPRDSKTENNHSE